MRYITSFIFMIISCISADIFQITTGYDTYPSWSPDGSAVAFQREQNNYNIYIKYLNSENPAIRITNNSNDNQGPAWSPNGEIIAFSSSGGTYFYNLITKETSFFVSGITACWSPDGNYIAFERGTTPPPTWIIWKKNVITGEETQLVSDTVQIAFPDWSPDGQLILYSRGDYLPTIWTIPANGGTPSQVPVAYGYSPKWSSDGTKLIFSAGSSLGGYSLYTFDMNTHELTQLMPAPISWWYIDPDWSPIGNQICYNFGLGLWVMDLCQFSFSTVGKIKAMYK